MFPRNEKKKGHKGPISSRSKRVAFRHGRLCIIIVFLVKICSQDKEVYKFEELQPNDLEPTDILILLSVMRHSAGMKGVNQGWVCM